MSKIEKLFCLGSAFVGTILTAIWMLLVITIKPINTSLWLLIATGVSFLILSLGYYIWCELRQANFRLFESLPNWANFIWILLGEMWLISTVISLFAAALSYTQLQSLWCILAILWLVYSICAWIILSIVKILKEK